LCSWRRIQLYFEFASQVKSDKLEWSNKLLSILTQRSAFVKLVNVGKTCCIQRFSLLLILKKTRYAVNIWHVNSLVDTAGTCIVNVYH